MVVSIMNQLLHFIDILVSRDIRAWLKRNLSFKVGLLFIEQGVELLGERAVQNLLSDAYSRVSKTKSTYLPRYPCIRLCSQLLSS